MVDVKWQYTNQKGKHSVMHTTHTSRRSTEKRQVINDCYAAEANVGLFWSIAFVPWSLARDASRWYLALARKWRLQGTLLVVLFCFFGFLPFCRLSRHFIILFALFLRSIRVLKNRWGFFFDRLKCRDRRKRRVV